MVDSEENIVHKDLEPTSIRLSKSVHKRLKQACLDRDVNKTQAIHEALELWLERKWGSESATSEGTEPTSQSHGTAVPGAAASEEITIEEIIERANERGDRPLAGMIQSAMEVIEYERAKIIQERAAKTTNRGNRRKKAG